MTQQQGISESKIDQTAQFERLLATSTISASRLVEAASIIGRTLQGIPKAQRKLTVARMRNLAQEFKRASASPGEEHLGLYALALLVTADTWEDFT